MVVLKRRRRREQTAPGCHLPHALTHSPLLVPRPALCAHLPSAWRPTTLTLGTGATTTCQVHDVMPPSKAHHTMGGTGGCGSTVSRGRPRRQVCSRRIPGRPASSRASAGGVAKALWFLPLHPAVKASRECRRRMPGRGYVADSRTANYRAGFRRRRFGRRHRLSKNAEDEKEDGHAGGRGNGWKCGRNEGRRGGQVA